MNGGNNEDGRRIPENQEPLSAAEFIYRKAQLSEEETARLTEQRAQRYYEVLKDYTRVSPPDKDALAELVMKAKGPARTMKQFAEEVGSTSSTLSRIVNKQTRSANSDKLIADIAAHADPESGVTFDMLMEAHGMKSRRRAMMGSGRIFESSVKRIILAELYERKYLMMDSENETLNGIGFGQKFDFVLTTNALKEDNRQAQWAFESFFVPQRESDSIPRSYYYLGQRMMRLLGALYTSGNPYDKISFVMANKPAFEDIKKRPWNVSLKDEISIILIDLEMGCFVEEFIFPCESDNRKNIFYKIERPEESTEEEMGLMSWNDLASDDTEWK